MPRSEVGFASAALRSHFLKGAFPYSSKVSDNVFDTGFGNWINSDPVLGHLENPTPGEYRIPDILGAVCEWGE